MEKKKNEPIKLNVTDTNPKSEHKPVKVQLQQPQPSNIKLPPKKKD